MSIYPQDDIVRQQQDYQLRKMLEEGDEHNIFKAAVEWYEATLREQDAVLDRADDLALGKCVNDVWKAREALKDAVRKWKEAQA